MRAIVSAPFGCVSLEADDERLLDIALHMENFDLIAPTTPLLREASQQLEAYFQDPRQAFSLSLPLVGTAYQREVWQALCSIPPGIVQSYGQIAKALASAPRAVAGACRANHFPLVIPCHRVVASHGLGGYCGAATGPYLDLKRWLLTHEGYEFP